MSSELLKNIAEVFHDCSEFVNDDVLRVDFSHKSLTNFDSLPVAIMHTSGCNWCSVKIYGTIDITDENYVKALQICNDINKNQLYVSVCIDKEDGVFTVASEFMVFSETDELFTLVLPTSIIAIVAKAFNDGFEKLVRGLY